MAKYYCVSDTHTTYIFIVDEIRDLKEENKKHFEFIKRELKKNDEKKAG